MAQTSIWGGREVVRRGRDLFKGCDKHGEHEKIGKRRMVTSGGCPEGRKNEEGGELTSTSIKKRKGREKGGDVIWLMIGSKEKEKGREFLRYSEAAEERRGKGTHGFGGTRGMRGKDIPFWSWWGVGKRSQGGGKKGSS